MRQTKWQQLWDQWYRPDGYPASPHAKRKAARRKSQRRPNRRISVRAAKKRFKQSSIAIPEKVRQLRALFTGGERQ